MEMEAMAPRRTTRAHILVLAYPAQGHIPPLINLSKQLAAQGALVTLVNVHSIHSRLLEIWCATPRLDIDLRSLPFPYHIPFGYDASSHLDQANFVQALRQSQTDFEELLRHLLEEEDQPRVSCIVADYLWGWHLESAQKFGITGASYWPGSATWSTAHYHLPVMISLGDAPIEADNHKLIEYMPGVSPTRLSDFPYYARTVYKGTLEYLMQEQEKTLSAMNEHSWFLINSTEELEPEAFQAMKKIFGERYAGVGPLFPLNPSPGTVHGLRDEEGDCKSWLDSQLPKAVLYISFGSVAALTDTELALLAEALLESEQPFLWVLRQEQKDKALKEVMHEVDKMKGIIVSWVPQLEVLSHSAVGGFLSHCGWNSVFESISSGVPLLGWPCVVEQNLNCKFLVEDLKVGLRIKKTDKLEIVKLINEVMRKDSDVRRNAEMIQEKIRRAADQSGASQKSLKLFMEDVCSSDSINKRLA